jgi:hypothetical protein
MRITPEQIAAVEEQGWSVECISPLELRHSATASIATGLAAVMVVQVVTQGTQPAVAAALSPADELKLLHLQVQRLVQKAQADRNHDWRETFDAVFSDTVSCRIHELLRELDASLDYYSPDEGYDDDVLAFSRALDSHMSQLTADGKLD